jgi:hypothetical protein
LLLKLFLLKIIKMAQRKVIGKDILLFIDPNGGTQYETLVCLTSNGLNRTTSITDAASKCGPDSQPGSQTISIPFSGQIAVDPDAGKASEGDLHGLWADSTQIGWKIGPAIPIDGDVIYEGKGFISDLSSTQDMNGATFTSTIAVSGAVTKTIYPAS